MIKQFKITTIDWYIFRTTIVFTLFCLLLVGIIESMFMVLAEMQRLNDDYSLYQMFIYILYDTPNRIYRIFPMALLLGCLVGLGQLSSNNELTAIRTAGLSKLRTIYGAILAGILLSFLTALMGEYLVPYADYRSQIIQNNHERSQGFWAISKDYTIQVDSLMQDELIGINLYRIDNQALSQHIHGDRAILDKAHWRVPNATITSIEEKRIVITHQSNLILPVLIDDQALSALSADPEKLAITKLSHFIDYLEHNGLDSSEYRLAFWSKVFNPLTNLAMLLIASPLIFAQQRQQGIGARILIGVVLGLVIYFITEMLGHFIIIAGYAPIIGAIFPTLLAVGIALLLFWLLPN